METKPFDEFKNLFIQRIPRYSVQIPGQRWHTPKKKDKTPYTLSDAEILNHLNHQKYVACLSRYYPVYAAFDMDNIKLARVEKIRSDIGLDSNNSALFSSPSSDSYHLYFRPEYNGKPPTIGLLQNVLGVYARQKGIELYPQKNKCFRLPFGKNQNPKDFQDRYLKKWEDQLYWLEKRDDFDLSTVRMHQQQFDFHTIKPVDVNSLVTAINPVDILENGLPGPSTRDQLQFELVKYLFRQNVTIDDAQRVIFNWIAKKNNGYSKDYAKNPAMVRDHIKHQVIQYYTRMNFNFILPDTTHKIFKGFITEKDLVEIVNASEGSLPRMRFLFNLVKFMNPRRHRDRVDVHTDKLIEWSSTRTYLQHLRYFEGKGILNRGSGYLTGVKAKSLKLKWNYQSDSEAVLYSGRAVQGLEDAVRLTISPRNFKALLNFHIKHDTAKKMIKRLFDGGEKCINI